MQQVCQQRTNHLSSNKSKEINTSAVYIAQPIIDCQQQFSIAASQERYTACEDAVRKVTTSLLNYYAAHNTIHTYCKFQSMHYTYTLHRLSSKKGKVTISQHCPFTAL